MVDHESAEAAATALRMVIAGLAERVLDLVSAPEPQALVDRLAAYNEAASMGQSILLAAESAAMALQQSEI